jgi:hypothetical protein
VLAVRHRVSIVLSPSSASFKHQRWRARDAHHQGCVRLRHWLDLAPTLMRRRCGVMRDVLEPLRNPPTPPGGGVYRSSIARFLFKGDSYISVYSNSWKLPGTIIYPITLIRPTTHNTQLPVCSSCCPRPSCSATDVIVPVSQLTHPRDNNKTNQQNTITS